MWIASSEFGRTVFEASSSAPEISSGLSILMERRSELGNGSRFMDPSIMTTVVGAKSLTPSEAESSALPSVASISLSASSIFPNIASSSSSPSFFSVVAVSSRVQPKRSINAWTLESQSPGTNRSLFFRIFMTRSLLNSTRLHRTMFGICETGATVREVPITSNKSALGRSCLMSLWKRVGRPSPKKTMSGFTFPPQCVHLGVLPWSTMVDLTASASADRPQSVQEAVRKCPWHSTSFSSGIPAKNSRPSMFCE
mmetsp:Transcript_7049/g.17692  ORF Transcript_7049/g.17692 Transcript_7049/m.17692 type:complete len:254 (+) Transcript_7049:691-1452(+)